MAFYNAINDTNNFIISFTRNPINDFGVFARGYFRTASKLAEDLLSRERFSNYDAYPVVFLYRHSLELYLKNVIYKSALLLAFKCMDDIDSTLYNNHKLIILSEKVTEILQRLFPADEEIKHLSEKILRISFEFSEIDSDSFAYRYPINKQGKSSTKHHQIVNLKAIHSTMKELLEGLEVLDFGLDVETSKAQEIYEILERLQNAEYHP